MLAAEACVGSLLLIRMLGDGIRMILTEQTQFVGRLKLQPAVCSVAWRRDKNRNCKLKC
jgi:hypothetical protein